jgi:hypothetical protein
MKKTMILGAFASLMMVSCAKDYSCKCVTVESITGVSNSETITITGKKKDATASCDALNAAAGPITKTCTIQ